MADEDEDACKDVKFPSAMIYRFNQFWTDYYTLIDKSRCGPPDDATGEIICKATVMFPPNMNWGKWNAGIISGEAELIVYQSDEVITDSTNKKWWSTISVCSKSWDFSTDIEIRVNSLDDKIKNYDDKECFTYSLEKKFKDNPCLETMYTCSTYNRLMEQINTFYSGYAEGMSDSATAEQKAKALQYKNKYKAKKEELRNACSQSLSRTDYNDGCVVTCSNLSNDLSKFDDAFGISHSESECVSDNLFYWIFNVLKWIKYIIPVAVIILSTLDFIKAMAGEKDDELKKAQGRLVKRLIAAALIFLVPIIISFILEKMGFVSESCGLF